MSELRFRQFETTGDTGLMVWGGDEEILLENAAAGLYSVLAASRGIQKAVRREVTARGMDEVARLVAWLSEWLYLFDTEGFIGKSFGVERAGGGKVTGWGRGDLYDPLRHELRCGVKGVTYHDMDVRRVKNRLRARIILDI
jgi:SHS2 domain-containing protein